MYLYMNFFVIKNWNYKIKLFRIPEWIYRDEDLVNWIKCMYIVSRISIEYTRRLEGSEIRDARVDSNPRGSLNIYLMLHFELWKYYAS